MINCECGRLALLESRANRSLAGKHYWTANGQASFRDFTTTPERRARRIKSAHGGGSRNEGNLGGAIIEARAVEKSFIQPEGGKIEVIAATDLAIYPGTIVALLGPSGSGKSTLLRMLSGLARPSSGEVLWHGKPLDRQVPNVGIVFQSFALFPWLTVLENVEAPLEALGMRAAERRRRSLGMLDT